MISHTFISSSLSELSSVELNSAELNLAACYIYAPCGVSSVFYSIFFSRNEKNICYLYLAGSESSLQTEVGGRREKAVRGSIGVL